MEVPGGTATLQIRVTQQGVDDATVALNRLTDAANLAATQVGRSRPVTDEVTASFRRMGAGAGEGGLGLGRLEHGLAALAGQSLGTIPVVDRLATTFLTLGLGSTVTLGVVAAAAAIGFAWKEMHEEAAKAADEAQKLTEELHKFRLEEEAGPAGKFVAEIDATKKKLQELEVELVRAQKLSTDFWHSLAPEKDDPISIRDKIAILGKAIAEASKAMATAPLGQEFSRFLDAYDRALKDFAGKVKKDAVETTKDIAAGQAEANKRINDAAVEAQRDRLHALEAVWAEEDAQAKIRENTLIAVRGGYAQLIDMINAETEALRKSAEAKSGDPFHVTGGPLGDLTKFNDEIKADVNSLNDFTRAQLAALKGTTSLTEGLQAQALAYANLQQRRREAIASFGLGLLNLSATNSLQSFQQGVGAVGNLGTALGGTAGLGVGAFAQVISGLLTAAQAHREAAAALKAAGDAINSSLAGYGQGTGVAAQLKQNEATYQQIKQSIKDEFAAAARQNDRGAGQTAIDQYTQLEKTRADNARQIADDFWGGITQQLNALQGPAGAYQNSLIALQKQYDDNKRSADALNATAAQKAQIDALEAQQLKQLQDAEQKRLDQLAQQAKRAGEDIAVRGIRAGGYGSQADAMAFQLQQSRELQDAISNGMDDTTLALLKNTQALEASAFAAQQLAQQMQQSRSDIGRDVRLGFTTGAAGLETERGALGFGGLSNDDIKAMYTVFSGSPLSQSQEDLNNRIEQFLTDAGQWMPAATTAADAIASAAASIDSYNKQSIGTVTGISDAQAGGVLGRLDTSNRFLEHLVSIDAKMGGVAGGSTFAGATPSARGGGDTYYVTLEINAAEFSAIQAASPTFASMLDNANGRGLNRVRGGSGTSRNS